METDATVVQCRRVVLCLPPQLAREVSYTPALPDARARLIAGIEMGACVKFHAIYERPFWRARGLSGQAMASTGAIGLTYDNSPDDGTNRGVLVGFAVGDAGRELGQLQPADREREILSSLDRLFGPDSTEPEAIAVKDWGAEEWTGGGYAAHFPVGGWTSYGAAFREPCGRIHWAGTETASEWHGYMEGAIRSGDRAAREMLKGNQSPLPRTSNHHLDVTALRFILRNPSRPMSRSANGRSARLLHRTGRACRRLPTLTSS